MMDLGSGIDQHTAALTKLLKIHVASPSFFFFFNFWNEMKSKQVLPTMKLQDALSQRHQAAGPYEIGACNI